MLCLSYFFEEVVHMLKLYIITGGEIVFVAYGVRSKGEIYEKMGYIVRY